MKPMDTDTIIAVIRRRRDAVKDRCEGRVAAGMRDEAQVDWCIAEEYDQLLAEIEALSKTTAPRTDE